MLAYNGSIPGPTLKVTEGSTLTVHVTNRGDHETTVHWHGLRLENRFDGTHETQEPIPIGETFAYELSFPKSVPASRFLADNTRKVHAPRTNAWLANG